MEATISQLVVRLAEILSACLASPQKAESGATSRSYRCRNARVIAAFIAILVGSSGCATRFDPSNEFQASFSEKSGVPTKNGTEAIANKTVILFLVDGLSNQVLKSELLAGRLPQIRKHFLATKESEVFEARTSFPSLTFPAISTLLKRAPIHETKAIGNSLPIGSELLNFESVRDRSRFSELMRGKNIFTDIAAKGGSTVSLDYGLGIEASVSSSPLDIKMAFAAKTADFLYLDQKKLSSLKLLLSESPPAKWPEFIFVHLVGLDFISHQFGSRSEEARAYLQSLDRSLQEVFEFLRAEEAFSLRDHAAGNSRKIVSMMTADHGFSPVIRQKISVERILNKILPAKSVILNEHRLANIYLKKTSTKERLQEWGQRLLKQPGIEIVAHRSGDEVQVFSRTTKTTYRFTQSPCPHGSMALQFAGLAAVCPSHLPDTLSHVFYPYFLENLAYFFQAPNAPDLVVIPEGDAVFSEQSGGFHGGPTADEVLVPLLMRNAVLANPKQPPPLWDVLSFL